MTINPEYAASRGNKSVPTSSPALAIVSNQQDIQEFSQELANHNDRPLALPKSTTNAIEEMESPDYCSNFAPTEGTLFDKLTDFFIIYEVPIGLISKLLRLKDFRLNFMIDDSGSMGAKTDV